MFSNLEKTLSSMTTPSANDIVVAQRQMSTTLLTIVPESDFKDLIAKAANTYYAAATLVADQIDHTVSALTETVKKTAETTFSGAKA